MRWWQSFLHSDKILFGGMVILMSLSLVLLYGISLSDTGENFWRQVFFVALSLGAYFTLSSFHYHDLSRMNRVVYIVIVLLLVLVLVLPGSVRGSKRWISLGIFQLQPSEFLKLALILGLGRMLAFMRGEINTIKSLLWTAIFAGIPVALVLLEPDLGSATVSLAIWAGLVFISWIRLRYLFLLVLGAVVVATGFWMFGLQEFQRQRLEVFLNPSLDPAGQGYNIRQARIAVGSGQWFGLGVGRGVQSQLRFLPERHTDFIFATAAEETGFVGATFILAVYGAILWRVWVVLRRSRDELGRYISGGVFVLFFVHIGVNVAMNLGLAPITGIPLPFMSYGGSAMLTMSLGIGLVQSVAINSRRLKS